MNHYVDIYKVAGHIVKVITDIPEYDSDLCSNGGSYYQPGFSCKCPARDEELFIDDDSCGEFGNRIHAVLYRHGREIACANYGSMLSESEEYSDFNHNKSSHMFWANFAAKHLNYHIPLV